MRRAVTAVLALAALAACSPSKEEAAAPASAAAASTGAAAMPAPAADPAESAKVWTTKLYSRYGAEGGFNSIVTRDGVWDPDMLALMARVDRAQEAGDGAIFDFEPLCNCQDDTGMTFRVTDASLSAPGKAEVTVTRTIGTESGDVKLSLVKVGGDWRIHDVATRDVESYAALLTEAISAGD